MQRTQKKLYLHKILNVSSQYGIFNNVKNYFDVSSVRCCGEVAIELLALVLSYGVKHDHEVFLHFRQLVRIALEIGKVIPNGLVLDLFSEKICLVEEQDDRDAAKTAIVDNRVEDIDTLYDSICHAIL